MDRANGVNRDVKRQLEEILSERLMQMKQELAGRSSRELALRTGARYDANTQEFSLEVFGKTFLVHYPDFQVIEAENGAIASVKRQALILYYFKTANGTPTAGRWISFRELLDGMNYEKAFQGYSGDALVRALQGNLSRFKAAAEALRGIPQPMGDAAYSFWALPKVPLALVFWEGDEEFPARIQVLFDASAPNYLPTDSLAGLGAELCSMIRWMAQATAG